MTGRAGNANPALRRCGKGRERRCMERCAEGVRNPDDALKRKLLLFLKKKKQKDFLPFSGPGTARGIPNERMNVFRFSFSKENDRPAPSHA